MTAGYILVIVMLVLGGVIATLSDRLGTKVGKARLSLFKLRPRNTAVLVTVVTGSILSALTLGVLFALSKPLRTGVFKIDEVQQRLNTARKDLHQATLQKNQVEAELAQARAAQKAAKENLEQINQSLQQAIAEQDQTEAKLNSLRQQLNRVEGAKTRTEAQLNRVESAKAQMESQLDRTQQQLKTVSKQRKLLSSEISGLQTERQQLIEQRDRVNAQIIERDREIAQQDREIAERGEQIAERDEQIAQRDSKLKERQQAVAEREQAIAERDRVIAEREALLQTLNQQQTELEQQQAYLQQQVQVLEQDFQAIRAGTVVIRRGQILSAGVVRILEPSGARQAVERLLKEANRMTSEVLQPGRKNPNEQVIQITKTEVEQVIDRLKDGQDYVVRIVAAANYLRGEKKIDVFAEAEINRVVFKSGDVVAGTFLNPSTLSSEQVREELQQLIEACQFRARLTGIVGGRVQIADDRIETLVGFMERLQQYRKPLDIQAIAADVTYTAGPLKVDLVALENGQVRFQTGTQGSLGEEIPTPEEEKGSEKTGPQQLKRMPDN